MSNEERHEFYKVGSRPLFRGICIDKESISRRPHYIKDGEVLRRVWLNYSNQLPTHPLQAIVTAAIALKQI
ncbi:TPA: hypothetical protein VEQ20_005260 [Raoultella ornithinolytica]|nr:hypothetical protein [Raoultella ornithinolytica]